ncbi:9619_t:CDS:2 [Acaulospora morrowiae]|uniref:9619_t:CDS:1 n=1 Tax=Acaulospora morrowiae TaxID=94023 RepID=A0A9N8VHK0_9GLOM|nr:9619_t:CDS:2 [Acaulospora morrowiae]
MFMQSSFTLLLSLLVLIGCASAVEITVKVDELGLQFNPQNLTANKGDTIKWAMVHGKHIIQQSDSAGSCSNSTQANALSSGIIEEGSQYIYTITQDSGKIYYFCAYSSHCLLGEFGEISIGVGPSTVTDDAGTTNNSSAPHSGSDSLKGTAKAGIGISAVMATVIAIGILLIG